MREFWSYIYGDKSHMNLAGKIILGVPMFPFLLIFISVYSLAEFLFTKNKE